MKYAVKGVNHVNGYKILLVPDCLRGNPVGSDGWQYEHILILEEEMGRRFTPDECGHHLDGNRGNNRKENLLLMTKSTHVKLHSWLTREGITPKPYLKYPSCTICGVTLQGPQVACCSIVCGKIYKELAPHIPDVEILKELVATIPFTKIGEMFGVSDNGVRGWCRKLGIPTKRSIVRPPKEKTTTMSPPKLTESDKVWIKEHYTPYDKHHGARALGKKYSVNHSYILEIVKQT